MECVRTPDERFRDLPGWPFAPRYAEVPSGDGGVLRTHFVDEGPRDAPVVLLLHGEPSWGYLYRKMIPVKDFDKLLASAEPDTAVENYLTVLKETGAGLQEVNLLAWQDVDFEGL